MSFFTAGVTRSPRRRAGQEDGIPKGSGFLTYGSLFVTNHHVLPEAAISGRITLQFGYRQGESGEILPGRLYAVDAESFWLSSPTEAFDCTLIALGEALTDSGEQPPPLAL
ncbi:hypothetical protein WDV93_22950 [Pantoea ananatis]